MIWKRQMINNKKKYFICYSALFIVLIIAVYFSYFVNRVTFIWKPDGYQQHYTALVYIGVQGRRFIRELIQNHRLVLPMWDINIGYGADVLTTLQFYGLGNPFSLLSIFVPTKYTEYLYSFLAILYLYLTGIAFSCYCFKMKKTYIPTLGGSFSVLFCGYALFASVRHPFFLLLLFYFPLLLIGVERLFNDESPFLFSFIVFLSAISNFYLFYMIVVFCIIYVIIRFIYMRHIHLVKELRVYFVRFLLYGVIGVLMAGIILVPILRVFFGTTRANVKIAYYWLYSMEYYKKMITGFFNSNQAGSWTFFGFSGPAFLAIMALFGKKKSRRPLKTGLIVLSLLLCFPVAGKALNGFSYVTNRWCGIYAILVSYILVCLWDDMLTPTKRQVIWMSIGTICYFMMLLLLRTGSDKNAFANVAILLMMMCAIGYNYFVSNEGKYRKISSGILLAGVMVSSVITGHYLNDFNEKNYVSEHVLVGAALKNVLHSEAGAVKKINKDADYSGRYEGSGTIRNDNTIAGFPGLSFYWSLANGKISDYQKEMLIHTSTFKTSIDYFGQNLRTFLDTLSGVRYYVTKKDETKQLPYGFEKVGKKYGYTVYENKYALPAAYTYDTFLTRDIYDSMTALERQEALMQSMLIEECNEAELEGSFSKGNPSLSSRNIPYTMKFGTGIAQNKDGSIVVSEENAVMTLCFERVANSELYVYIRGLDSKKKTLYELYHDEDQDNYSLKKYNKLPIFEKNKIRYQNRTANRWALAFTRLDIELETDYSSVTLADKTPYYEYYEGEEDYLLNLGYNEAGCEEVTLKFRTPGVYSFDDLRVYAQPMGQYVQQVDKLKACSVTDTVVDGNSIRLVAEINKPKLLCLSFPYDEGWTAFVDGEEAVLMRANSMYMALALEKGKHTIELVYRTKGLKEGAIVSFTGLFALFLLLVVRRIRISQAKI